MKFPRRYLDEKEPTLKNFAKVVRSLEECVPKPGNGNGSGPRSREGRRPFREGRLPPAHLLPADRRVVTARR